MTIPVTLFLLVAMEHDYLTTKNAAARLGVSVTTLYAWLGLSDRGLLVIRGQQVTIDYYQSGKKGQGRIRIEAKEIERLRETMRVKPQPQMARRLPAKPTSYPGITVPLGHPER